MSFTPITDEEDRIGKLIVDSAFAVHKNLGPGLLENVYEICFCHELQKRGISFQRQAVVPIIYGLTKDLESTFWSRIWLFAS